MVLWHLLYAVLQLFVNPMRMFLGSHALPDGECKDRAPILCQCALPMLQSFGCSSPRISSRLLLTLSLATHTSNALRHVRLPKNILQNLEVLRAPRNVLGALLLGRTVYVVTSYTGFDASDRTSEFNMAVALQGIRYSILHMCQRAVKWCSGRCIISRSSVSRNAGDKVGTSKSQYVFSFGPVLLTRFNTRNLFPSERCQILKICARSSIQSSRCIHHSKGHPRSVDQESRS